MKYTICRYLDFLSFAHLCEINDPPPKVINKRNSHFAMDENCKVQSLVKKMKRFAEVEQDVCESQILSS